MKLKFKVTAAFAIFIIAPFLIVGWISSSKATGAMMDELGRTTVAELDSTTFDSAGMVTHVGTNQIGRYPIHMHHVMGPAASPSTGYQYTLIGNAIDDSPKWGIAIHNTHFGQVRGNVMYNVMGAHLMTEDGSESYNVIEKNFAVRGNGTGGRQGGGREGVETDAARQVATNTAPLSIPALARITGLTNTM